MSSGLEVLPQYPYQKVRPIEQLNRDKDIVIITTIISIISVMLKIPYQYSYVEECIMVFNKTIVMIIILKIHYLNKIQGSAIVKGGE